MQIIHEMGYDLKDLILLTKEEYVKWFINDMYGIEEEGIASYYILQDMHNEEEL